jgi:hypothetical protein
MVCPGTAAQGTLGHITDYTEDFQKSKPYVSKKPGRNHFPKRNIV